MRKAYVDTPDGQIHYGIEGCGEPLLLLHQTPRSMDEYSEVIPILGKRRQVIAMDTMGCGNSDKPPREYSIGDYAKAVIFLLDNLEIRQTSIVGHHTGAYIGIEIAAAYPNRVDKLILSGVRPYFDEKQRQRIANLHPMGEEKDDGSHIIELWDNLRKQLLPPSLINRVIIERLRADKDDGHRALSKYHVKKALRLIKCPTLLIYGIKDLPGFTTEDGLKASQAINGSKVVFVEGGTAYILNQMPIKFAKIVLDFLENRGT